MTAPPAQLRSLLETATPIIAPGAFNALFAKLIEEAGFPAVYLSGAGVSNSLLGEPDLGILTQTEMAGIADHVCRAVEVPVVADGDTGYGGVHNVARTIELYERAGVAGIQIEDQAFPKKCGHFEGKEVVDPKQMLQRIHAALDARSGPEGIVIIARTDARAPLGLDAAIERAHAYGEAGADVLFVEAPQTADELARVGSELSDYHLMANMVEFGKTPLLPADVLGALGFSLIIYPGSITRAIVPAARAVLEELRMHGTSAAWLEQMATFGDVNDLLGLDEATGWGDGIAARAEGGRPA
jgi:2-methylisocitrate lyase-like PEP mutase family enzyme